MTTSALPWLRDAALYSSGSRALAELLAWGALKHGWGRVWLPSYYCPDVPATAADAVPKMELRSYADHNLRVGPALELITAVPGDVVVVANQLGIRPRPARGAPRGVVLVEDHSHDLASDWALGSDADYAFASLRKTLPLPDGGAVWSPARLALPPESPTMADDADGLALGATLQRRFERAAADGTVPFRALARSAFGRGMASRREVSPVSRALLPHMPAGAWRDARRRNFNRLADAVRLRDGVRLLLPPAGSVAFAYTLVFDAQTDRDQALARLIARAVIPAVLWPLDPSVHPWTGAADADLARRILSVHCDQRFSMGDMEALAVVLRDAI